MPRQAGANTAQRMEVAEKVYRNFANYHGYDEFGGASDNAVRELIVAIVRAVSDSTASQSLGEKLPLGADFPVALGFRGEPEI